MNHNYNFLNSKYNIFTNNSGSSEVYIQAGKGEKLVIEADEVFIKGQPVTSSTGSSLNTDNFVFNRATGTSLNLTSFTTTNLNSDGLFFNTSTGNYLKTETITTTNLIVSNLTVLNSATIPNFSSNTNTSLLTGTLTNLLVTSSTNLQAPSLEVYDFSTTIANQVLRNDVANQRGYELGIDNEGTNVFVYASSTNGIIDNEERGQNRVYNSSLTLVDEEIISGIIFNCGERAWGKISASYGYVYNAALQSFSDGGGASGFSTMKKNGNVLNIIDNSLFYGAIQVPRVGDNDFKNIASGLRCFICGSVTNNRIWLHELSNNDTPSFRVITGITTASVSCFRAFNNQAYFFTSNTGTNGLIRCYNMAGNLLFSHTGTSLIPVGLDIRCGDVPDANNEYDFFSLSPNGQTLIVFKFNINTGLRVIQTLSLPNTYLYMRCTRSGNDVYLLRSNKLNVLNIRRSVVNYAVAPSELTLPETTDDFEVINNGVSDFIASGNNSNNNNFYLLTIGKTQSSLAATNNFLFNNTGLSMNIVNPINIDTNLRPFNITTSSLNVIGDVSSRRFNGNINAISSTITNLLATSSTTLQAISNEIINFSTGITSQILVNSAAQDRGKDVGIDVQSNTLFYYASSCDFNPSSLDRGLVRLYDAGMNFLNAENIELLTTCNEKRYTKITASYGYIYTFMQEEFSDGGAGINNNGLSIMKRVPQTLPVFDSLSVINTNNTVIGTGFPRVELNDFKNYKSGLRVAMCASKVANRVWFVSLSVAEVPSLSVITFTSDSVCCFRDSGGVPYFFTSNSASNGTIRCYENSSASLLFTYNGTVGTPVGHDIVCAQDPDVNGEYDFFSLSSSGQILTIFKFNRTTGFRLVQTITLSNTYLYIRSVRSGNDIYLLRNNKLNVLNIKRGFISYITAPNEIVLTETTDDIEVINNGTTEYLAYGNSANNFNFYLAILTKAPVNLPISNALVLNNNGLTVNVSNPINIQTNFRNFNITTANLNITGPVNATVFNGPISSSSINSSSMTSTNINATSFTGTNLVASMATIGFLRANRLTGSLDGSANAHTIDGTSSLTFIGTRLIMDSNAQATMNNLTVTGLNRWPSRAMGTAIMTSNSGNILNETATLVPNWTFSSTQGGMAFASNVFTVPRTGTYFVTGSITWNVNGTGQRRLWGLINNAASPRFFQSILAGRADSGTTLTLSGYVNIPSGQTFGLIVFQSSGGNLTLYATASEPQFFQIYEM